MKAAVLRRLPGALRRLTVYTLAVALPVACKFLLKADIPAWLLTAIACLKLILVECSLLQRPVRLAVTGKILSACASILFAVVLLAAIVITPYAAYVFFFRQVSSFNFEPLYASNLFVLLVSFCTLLYVTALLRDKAYKHLLGLCGVLAGILLVVFPTPLALVVCLLCLAGYLFLLLKSRALYLVITFLCCGLLVFLPSVFVKQPEGSSLVDQVFYPGLRRVINDLFPGFPLLMDIPGYGMGHADSKLGGSTLLTSTPILEVWGGAAETLYLQTNAYDTYTGKRWSQSRLFSQSPVALSRDELLAGGEDYSVLDIKILTEAFFTVPYTGDLFGFAYQDTYYRWEPAFWQGIEFKEELAKNQTLHLFRRKTPVAGEQDPGFFLQLPGNLPARIRTLAALLAAGTNSQAEVLERIQEFLSVNNVYDLQAPAVREHEDFVDKFLFDDKRGYCTHFASAFAVLARLNGIPARYAVGYLVHLPEATHSRIVTARTAHAWPEIRLGDSGWVTWEATRALSLDYYQRYATEEMFRYLLQGSQIARNALTLRQLQDVLGIRLGFAEQQKRSAQPLPPIRWEGLYWLLWLMPLCLGIIGLILVKRTLHFRNPYHRACRIIARIVKLYRLVPAPENAGWVRWHRDLCAAYHPGREEAARLLEAAKLLAIIQKIAYSSHGILPADLTYLTEARRYAQKAKPTGQQF